MRYGALFGGGICIYALMFLVWSGFVTYGFVEGLVPRIIGLSVLIGVAYAAGRATGAHSWRDILPYSISWGVMMAILDAVFTVPFAGWQIYADWSLWFGYAVVIVAPLLALYPRFERFSPPPSA